MDKRNWPWKKKSLKETIIRADPGAASGGSFNGKLDDQRKSKTVTNYVQLSQERYAHLSEMEDRVKVLNEKLSNALTEITTNENLVKQHAKVAEDAVSGWEKAQAEARSLKSELESVMLIKLTAEERSLHLDGALKECMKQVRIVKEESEERLHDIVFAKTRQWENVKFELEARINTSQQELLKLSAENDALSRSILQHSDMLMRITEEKSQADAEIELLKANIQTYEKETNSLRYEVHVVSKELEIRNEEKNMCSRSAEVANKQHLEDVKKILKLEAECQRLRGLVRKKLPGPAALAQMKQEVESVGMACAEDRLRRSPAKCNSPRLGTTSDFALENVQRLRKENEFLSAQLLAMEEEIKVLKETLSDRDGELQASRELFESTATNFQSVEAQIRVLNQQKCSVTNEICTGSPSSKNRSKLQSPTSILDDGIDEESCSPSSDSTLMPKPSHLQGKLGGQLTKTNSSDQEKLELMDDFLEMEKLACLTSGSNRTGFVSDRFMDLNMIENYGGSAPTDDLIDMKSEKQLEFDLRQASSSSCSKENLYTKTESVQCEILFSKLQAKIELAFESQSKNFNIKNLLAGIRQILQTAQEELLQHSVKGIAEQVQLNDASCDQKHFDEKMVDSADYIVSLTSGNTPYAGKMTDETEGLKNSILQIHNFVVSLGKEAAETHGRSSDVYRHCQNVEDFSSSLDKCTNKNEHDFLQALFRILSETKELCCLVLHDKNIDVESNSFDCIDKVTLLEKKVIQHEPGKDKLAVCSSNSQKLQGKSESHSISEKRDISKDFEQLKLENDRLMMNLASTNEILVHKNKELLEAEQQFVEFKSQLAACQKSNDLAETQLKCMTESYTILESRFRDLDSEINILRTKAEMLNDQLQQERQSHQDNLAKYKDLLQQMERKEQSLHLSEAETDDKEKQEREIAAAAEKLAECQETIIHLGRQLKAMHPQTTVGDSSFNPRHHSGFTEGRLSTSSLTPQGDSTPKAENLASILKRTGGESPFDVYSCQFSPSDNNASSKTMSPVSSKRPKHRPSWSYSSNSSNISVEKQGHRFSRFFS